MLAGCSEQEEPVYEPPMQTLQLIAGTQSFFDVSPIGTRAPGDPGALQLDGFVTYSSLHPQTTEEYATIGAFMATDDQTGAPVPGPGKFTYQGLTPGYENRWTSSIRIEDGKQYYIYGFMPFSNNASIEALDTDNDGVSDNDYSKGAKLTINNLDVLTPADVCVIVGVLKGSKTSGDITGVPATDLKLGQFGYVGSSADEGNYVYLLLDHLYAGVHFKVKIDADYAELRTIRVKNMILRAFTNNVASVNATVTLTAGDYDPALGETPLTCSFTPNAGASSTAETPLFEAADGNSNGTIDEDELLTLTTAFHEFLSCYAPNTCTNFKLITTYNVYDRKGNLIREDQTAENNISLSGTLPRGQISTFNITVKPTYLYVLSDPDLDSPEFVLN